MKKKLIASILILFFLVGQNVTLADVVVTDSGNTYTGKITSITPDNIEIETNDGKFILSKSKLKEMKFSTENNNDESTKVPTTEVKNKPAEETPPQKAQTVEVKANLPEQVITPPVQPVVKTPSATGLIDVKIPKDLVIPVSLLRSLRSDALFSGQKIPIQIFDDVKVNDIVVFKKGDEGIVIIGKARKASYFGTAGKIIIEKGQITDRFGNEYDVKLGIKKKGEDSNIAGRAVPIIGGLVLAWPFLLFGLKKGDQTEVEADTVFQAFIASDKTIKIDKQKAASVEE
jgi:hypothetical protein